MGWLGGYAGAFLGSYLGAVAEVEVVEPVGFLDYVGVLQALDPDPLGYRGELGGPGYRGELEDGVAYLGQFGGDFSYRGALAPKEDSVMSFSMVAGDRLPSLERVCVNAETGEVVDLTGGSASSKFKIGAGGTLKTGTVEITNAAAGEVRCDWANGDIDQAGICHLRVVVTIGGKAQTFPSDGSWFTFPIAAAS